MPCLPTSAKRLPSDDGWLHEIKHDGIRVIARKDGKRVNLYSRSGNDLTSRPRITEPVASQSADLHPRCEAVEPLTGARKLALV